MHFIIYEQTGDWTPALRRWLPATAVFETRLLFEIWDRLELDPASVVAIEFSTDKADAILAAIVRINRNFPQARCVVLLSRVSHSWEQVVREAGAIHVVTSPRDLKQVGQLVARHLQNLPPAGPANGKMPDSLEEQILATLPWSE